MLSPRERPGEKLNFYAQHGVKEYLEVDLVGRGVRLLGNAGGEWKAIERSGVIDLDVGEVTALLG